jgi:heme a synthase
MVHLHLTMAVILAVLILVLGFLVRRPGYRSVSGLRGPANALLLVLTVQLCLGFGTWIANYALPWADWLPALSRYVIQAKGYWESLIVTAHQATGSLLIALSVWMVCRTARRQVQLVRKSQSFTMERPSRALDAEIS